jgi:hypothetical protein
MPTPVEQQPWYTQWREAVDNLIRAREALLEKLEATKGAPQRKTAEAGVQAALTKYKLVAGQI